MSEIGRNELCRCGSGLKYKRCCAGKPAPAPKARADAAPLAALAYAMEEAGRLQEAVAAYWQALAVEPAAPLVLNNLGLLLQRLGQAAEAEGCFRKAVALAPLNPALHFNLGLLLQDQRNHEGARRCYEELVRLQPGNAQAHTNLGAVLESLGRDQEAVAAYRRAIAADPRLVGGHNRLALALARLVPRWHIPMMNDALRNDAYQRALQAVVTPQSRVFEIGTGGGLLAMMAARLGAASVTTCEAVPLVAQAARTIVATNGLQSKIDLLHKSSTDVQLGTDLDEAADILVCEIFSSELLGERVLSSIEDAKSRLLKPNAKVIPAAASIMVALFAGRDIASNLVVEDVEGFDLRPFNSLAARRQTVFREDLDIELLSDPVEAFRFDLQNDSVWPAQTRSLRLPVHQGGRCLGIVQWIRLETDREHAFENHPALKIPACSWTRCVYLLPEPATVHAGVVAHMTAVHNRVCPWFVIEHFEAPEALSVA